MSGGRAFVDITMSLDGFITGPNDSVESPLGEGGDRLHRQYLKAGLIDEMQIHVVPVLVGDGRRLFEDLGTEQIELEGTRVIDSKDVIHLQFRPPKTKEKKGGAS
jgi:riboflavin biosynthesis pyrimidine reductase